MKPTGVDPSELAAVFGAVLMGAFWVGMLYLGVHLLAKLW